MFVPTPLTQHTPKQVCEFFVHQVKQWRLDVLFNQLLGGQHAAKCQFGWYLQYQIPATEVDQFLHAVNDIEQHDPLNPFISFVKMNQHLYGLGSSASLERSRHYQQQYQERFALTSPDPQDIFLHTLAEVNRLPKFLRCQWFASQGNGEAICDLAYYYLIEATKPEETAAAIELLIAAANFNHARALSDLAQLYREGKLIKADENKAQHYARKAFLRKIILYPDKNWQIKDLPIAGYAERLVSRSKERIYHETLCLINPEYDFLFAKKSTLVPLVHTPSTKGVLENLKNIVPYFIEQIIEFDKQELRNPRLKRALETLINEYQLPKVQRDQIHLLLAYQHSLENNPSVAAQHVMALKQPHVYMPVIQSLDPEGKIGKLLLKFAQLPESRSFDEADALVDYGLVYLIASISTLDAVLHYQLQQQLSARFINAPLSQLMEWHLQYCQVRYALYKIQRFINVSARGWHFLHQHHKKAQEAWLHILSNLERYEALNQKDLDTIQEAYPLLTSSLEQLRQAESVVLKQASKIAILLKQ